MPGSAFPFLIYDFMIFKEIETWGRDTWPPSKSNGGSSNCLCLGAAHRERGRVVSSLTPTTGSEPLKGKDFTSSPLCPLPHRIWANGADYSIFWMLEMKGKGVPEKTLYTSFPCHVLPHPKGFISKAHLVFLLQSHVSNLLSPWLDQLSLSHFMVLETSPVCQALQ